MGGGTGSTPGGRPYRSVPPSLGPRALPATLQALMSAIQQTLRVTLCTSGAFWACVAKGDPGPLVILQAPQFQSNQSIFQESDSYICLAWYIIQSNEFKPVDRVHLQHHNAVVCALPSPLLQNLQQYSALDLDIFLCMLSKAC